MTDDPDAPEDAVVKVEASILGGETRVDYLKPGDDPEEYTHGGPHRVKVTPLDTAEGDE